MSHFRKKKRKQLFLVSSSKYTFIDSPRIRVARQEYTRIWKCFSRVPSTKSSILNLLQRPLWSCMLPYSLPYMHSFSISTEKQGIKSPCLFRSVSRVRHGLNAPQSEIVTEFQLNVFFKPLESFHLCVEIPSDSKEYCQTSPLVILVRPQSLIAVCGFRLADRISIEEETEA